MGKGNLVKFLGTAGARFVVAKQLRYSAGVYIQMREKKFILDPGPGTLVRCAKSRPPIDATELDGIILTHAHIDHSNDVNILIDAMTLGGLENGGTLFAPYDCIDGGNKVVLPYLREFLKEIVILKENNGYKLGDVSFSTSVKHAHQVETYGIMFDYGGKKLSFMVDTEYFPELVNSYKGSNILVINLVRFKPHPSGKVMHLCIDDAKKIISGVGPQKAVLTHFGMTMVRAKPWKVAAELSNEIGVEVIAASDGMTLDLE